MSKADWIVVASTSVFAGLFIAWYFGKVEIEKQQLATAQAESTQPTNQRIEDPLGTIQGVSDGG